MPRIGLIRAGAVAAEDLEDEKGPDFVGDENPAVGDLAGGVVRVVDEDDEFPVDAEIVRIVGVPVANIGEVTPDLVGCEVALAFLLVVDGPLEASTVASLKDLGEVDVGMVALSPPGGDGCLDTAVLHGSDVLADDRRVTRVVIPQCRVIASVWTKTALRPSLREPWIIEDRADRESETAVTR
jgi:hypothetical protein